MTALLESLSSIPIALWTGLLGALIALAGVFVTNRGNTQRQQAQLRQDAAEKARERTAVLRRETCLRLVETLAQANAYLGALAQADLAKANAGEGLQGFFAAASKLQIVAEPQTALLVSELATRYGELLLRLMVDLLPVQLARGEAATCDTHYQEVQVEIRRVLGEMGKLNETGQPAPAVFAALGRAYDGYRARADALATERLQHGLRCQELTVAFQRRLFAELKAVGELQIPVLVEIRRDLGLGGDLEAFRDHMASQSARLATQLDLTLAALDASLAALRAQVEAECTGAAPGPDAGPPVAAASLPAAAGG